MYAIALFKNKTTFLGLVGYDVNMWTLWSYNTPHNTLQIYLQF